METLNQPLSKSDQSLFELQIDQENNSYLNEMARWGKFLSIVGFVLSGLLTLILLIAAFSGSSYDSMYTPYWQRALGPIMLIIILLLYFFPCLYLFNFSTNMKIALRNDDQEYLLTAFKNLKACFKFVGVSTLVMISIEVIVVLFVLVKLGTL